MKELDDSGYAGIAYLVPAANGSTSISVMIAQVVGDETLEPSPRRQQPVRALPPRRA